MSSDALVLVNPSSSALAALAVWPLGFLLPDKTSTFIESSFLRSSLSDVQIREIFSNR